MGSESFFLGLVKFLTDNPIGVILPTFQILFKIRWVHLTDNVKFCVLGSPTSCYLLDVS